MLLQVRVTTPRPSSSSICFRCINRTRLCCFRIKMFLYDLRLFQQTKSFPLFNSTILSPPSSLMVGSNTSRQRFQTFASLTESRSSHALSTVLNKAFVAFIRPE